MTASGFDLGAPVDLAFRTKQLTKMAQLSMHVAIAKIKGITLRIRHHKSVGKQQAWNGLRVVLVPYCNIAKLQTHGGQSHGSTTHFICQRNQKDGTSLARNKRYRW